MPCLRQRCWRYRCRGSMIRHLFRLSQLPKQPQKCMQLVDARPRLPQRTQPLCLLCLARLHAVAGPQLPRRRPPFWRSLVRSSRHTVVVRQLLLRSDQHQLQSTTDLMAVRQLSEHPCRLQQRRCKAVSPLRRRSLPRFDEQRRHGMDRGLR